MRANVASMNMPSGFSLNLSSPSHCQCKSIIRQSCCYLLQEKTTSKLVKKWELSKSSNSSFIFGVSAIIRDWKTKLQYLIGIFRSDDLKKHCGL